MSAVTAPPLVAERSPAARYLRAELSALGRRPGVRIAVGVWLLQILVFAYVVQFTVYRAMGAELDPTQAANMVTSLTPELAGTYVAASVPGYGIPVFVVLGALVAAADYRSGTLGTLLARCPHRVSFLLSRYAALLVILAVTAVLTVLLGLVSGAALTMLEGGPLAIAPENLVAGAGGVWLMSTGYATLGFALGILLRNLMTASVVGIAWLVAVEMLLIGGLAGALPAVDAVRSVLLTPNVGSLAAALDSSGVTSGQGLPGVGAVTQGWVAVLVILLWTVVALTLAVRAFRRRDVL
ncbi:ABC transporter permease [Ornithinimicrobium sp. F0845]|uniref:ABC transporter permease subunit n=1 Tax=Ornithinimicrobium sp. F0845 TaxID=2926412 RepID=UPI001FF245C3|nr:ABC transporter permease subunit [Ornithinimicrobium sp. F0845]MCK0112060.1 ABC transporter permease [Ornithinimicrobium sp. F0845]